GVSGELQALGFAAAPYPNLRQLANLADRLHLRLRLKSAADDRQRGCLRSRQDIGGIAAGSAGANLAQHVRFELSERPSRLAVEQKKEKTRAVLGIGGVKFRSEILAPRSRHAVQRGTAGHDETASRLAAGRACAQSSKCLPH